MRLWLVMVLGLLAAGQGPPTKATRTSSDLRGTTIILIEALSSKDEGTVQFSVDSLVRIGCPAVPTIVEMLDDRTLMLVPRVMFLNVEAGAPEAIRQHTPQKKVDCLVAVLHEITGEPLSPIYNGATEEERRLAVVAWRRYFDANRERFLACRWEPA